MARSAASKAEQAADALEAFLRDRTAAALSTDPGQTEMPSQKEDGSLDDGVGFQPRRGARQVDPAAVQAFTAEIPLRLPHTDWLFHRLVMTGPAATVAAFRAAASGAGTIPWRLDGDSLQEDWFHLLGNPAHRSLSLIGARVLAGRPSHAPRLGRGHSESGQSKKGNPHQTRVGVIGGWYKSNSCGRPGAR